MENTEFVWLIGEKADKTPIEYEVMAWANTQLPETYILNDDYLQNQGLKTSTAYMCTAFGTTNWCNEVKHKRLNPERYNWETLWNYMISKDRLDPKVWAYLIDALKSAKELNYINGWTNVYTIESIKQALFNDKFILVWSTSIDWKKTILAPFIAIKWNTYWHAFIIVGYDDKKQLLVCENSYWDKFDKGRFYIKYEDFWLLFNSKFAVHIDDINFQKLNKLLAETKKFNYKDFYDLYLKNKSWTERRLWELAAQIRYIWKVNNKELLKLL